MSPTIRQRPEQKRPGQGCDRDAIHGTSPHLEALFHIILEELVDQFLAEEDAKRAQDVNQ